MHSVQYVKFNISGPRAAVASIKGAPGIVALMRPTVSQLFYKTREWEIMKESGSQFVSTDIDNSKTYFLKSGFDR